MIAESTGECTLALTADERNTLVGVLEDLCNETRVELHRTDMFKAKEVVAAKLSRIESILRKLRASNAS